MHPLPHHGCQRHRGSGGNSPLALIKTMKFFDFPEFVAFDPAHGAPMPCFQHLCSALLCAEVVKEIPGLIFAIPTSQNLIKKLDWSGVCCCLGDIYHNQTYINLSFLWLTFSDSNSKKLQNCHFLPSFIESFAFNHSLNGNAWSLTSSLTK